MYRIVFYYANLSHAIYANAAQMHRFGLIVFVMISKINQTRP